MHSVLLSVFMHYWYLPQLALCYPVRSVKMTQKMKRYHSKLMFEGKVKTHASSNRVPVANSDHPVVNSDHRVAYAWELMLGMKNYEKLMMHDCLQ